MSVKIGLIISFIALVSSLVSTAIPYWVYGSEGSASLYEGLWKGCVDSDEFPETLCLTIPSDDVPMWFNAVRAMMIIGMVFLAIGNGVGLHSIIKKASSMFAGFMVAGGGLCCLIAGIIFGADYGDAVQGSITTLPIHLHAGFGLSIVSGILGMFGGAWLKIKRDSEYTSV